MCCFLFVLLIGPRSILNVKSKCNHTGRSTNKFCKIRFSDTWAEVAKLHGPSCGDCEFNVKVSSTPTSPCTEVDNCMTVEELVEQFQIKYVEISCVTNINEEPEIQPSRPTLPVENNAFLKLMAQQRCIPSKKTSR